MDRDCLPVLLVKFPTKWTERDAITAISEYQAAPVVQEWSGVGKNTISWVSAFQSS